jgi:RHS repeat-associated protein
MLGHPPGVTYDYDADGQRVEKSSGTMYWPGPSGTLAETDLTGNINEEYIYFNGERIARVDRPSGTVHYYFSNHLGSASVITDALGNIEEQDDYYPYGGIAYTAESDTNHYKFTGKDRDGESGLDDFSARYYSSSTGRWFTPDWSSSPVPVPYADLNNPQSLNLYAYVGGDPTSHTDPDGHRCYSSGGCNSDGPQDAAGQASAQTAQNNGWSLSWQISASANFLGQELMGVADTTIAPVVNAVEHPVDTVEGLANAVEHPVATAGAIVNGVVDTAKGVANGDPRAIGQVAGTVIATAAGVKGAQAASEEAQGLRAVANEVRSGPRAGELQHVGIVNSKGNLIHLGREGADWHIGIGRGGGASGAGAAFHIPIPSWLGNLLNN